jgi:hypothetical protein
LFFFCEQLNCKELRLTAKQNSIESNNVNGLLRPNELSKNNKNHHVIQQHKQHKKISSNLKYLSFLIITNAHTLTHSFLSFFQFFCFTASPFGPNPEASPRQYWNPLGLNPKVWLEESRHIEPYPIRTTIPSPELEFNFEQYNELKRMWQIESIFHKVKNEKDEWLTCETK